MKKKRILDETNNLLHLYDYHVGNQEVPKDFHQWCCLSGVAAVVQDHVWVEKFRGGQLTPSLFTFLIGPSGVGKGQAIDLIADYLNNTDINVFNGATSAAKLTEIMASSGKTEASLKRSKIMLIMEELTMCIGAGPMAFDFVRWMTGLYAKGRGKIRKATVASANAIIVKHNVNWLAGTTTDWLAESLPKRAIEGGFLGRLITVNAKYNFAHRVYRPQYPWDYDEVREHIQKRFIALTKVEGEFKTTERAARMEEHWYMTRPEPTDERLYPTWKRQHDQVLKLAMTFSLCESHDKKIRARHMEAGIGASNNALSAHRDILAASSTTQETSGIDVIEKKLRVERVMQRSTLMSYCIKNGIDKLRLDRHLATLYQAKRIKSFQITDRKGKRLGLAYEYIGGKVIHLKRVR